MINMSSIRRDIVLLVIGAAVGTAFGLLVAYPELLGTSRENSARIDNNRVQIELLWEAHDIEHTRVPNDVEEGR